MHYKGGQMRIAAKSGKPLNVPSYIRMRTIFANGVITSCAPLESVSYILHIGPVIHIRRSNFSYMYSNPREDFVMEGRRMKKEMLYTEGVLSLIEYPVDL
jgi:hypothetical protein